MARQQQHKVAPEAADMSRRRPAIAKPPLMGCCGEGAAPRDAERPLRWAVRWCLGLGLLDCNLCRWCLLAVAHERGEDGCSSRQVPSPADWTRYAARQLELCVRRATRTSADSSAAEAQPRGRRQTDRSTEEQAAYHAAYMRWYTSEATRLSAEVSAALAERAALLLQPLAPSSESGEFSGYEKLQLEFSTMLHVKARRPR